MNEIHIDTNVDARQEAIDLACSTVEAIKRINTTPVSITKSEQPTFSEFCEMMSAAVSDPIEFVSRTGCSVFASPTVIVEYANATNQVTYLRKHTKLTQIAFAKKYQTSHRTVTNWEQDISKPNDSHLMLLAYAVFCEYN